MNTATAPTRPSTFDRIRYCQGDGCTSMGVIRRQASESYLCEACAQKALNEAEAELLQLKRSGPAPKVEKVADPKQAKRITSLEGKLERLIEQRRLQETSLENRDKTISSLRADLERKESDLRRAREMAFEADRDACEAAERMEAIELGVASDALTEQLMRVVATVLTHHDGEPIQMCGTCRALGELPEEVIEEARELAKVGLW